MVTDHNEIDDNEYIPGMNCGHLLMWSLANQGALQMWTKSVLFDIQSFMMRIWNNLLLAGIFARNYKQAIT